MYPSGGHGLLFLMETAIWPCLTSSEKVCAAIQTGMEDTVNELHGKVKDLTVVLKGEKIIQHSKFYWNPSRQFKC